MTGTRLPAQLGARSSPAWRACTRLRELATEPRDPAALLAFRSLFGLILFGSSVRFVLKGWVEELYLAPAFHFSYFGCEWVRVPPPAVLYAVFGAMMLAALGLALGKRPRLCAGSFALLFSYVELLDKATYLNHYYFVSWMALLLCLLRIGSGNLLQPGRITQRTVPAYVYFVLRLQVGVVYVFAGLAKLNRDWLLRAEPVSTWLRAYADVPLVGELLLEPWVGYAMSWAGAVFDLSIVGWLLWSRSRRWAYGVAVLFHGLIWLMFPIGVFSWVMLASATLFFAPGWPRRFLRALPRFTPAEGAAQARPLGAFWLTLIALYVGVQLALPLRFLAFPGNVNWTEEAFRYAWRVMLIEKTGQLEYRVVAERPAASWVVNARLELTEFQHRMLVTQPDMIHEYAVHLARRYQARGHAAVHVYADCFVSLNGRPSQRLIDPNVDLASEPRTLLPKKWILPE